MRRVGLVGPWHPRDAIDLLLIRHLSVLVERDLSAELVVVAGRGREHFDWEVPAIGADAFLSADLAGLLVTGDLGTSADALGVVPSDVWLTAAALARARGVPTAWHGVRFLGDAFAEPTTRLLRELVVEPLLLDEASARLLGSPSELMAHPLRGLPGISPEGPRSGRVLHASPSILSRFEAEDASLPGDAWVALRPGRADRLIGLPGNVQRRSWRGPETVVEMFASASEVVTDDPAVAAVAESLGVDGSTIVPAAAMTAAPAQAWLLTVARLTSGTSADARPLRRLVQGASVELGANPSQQLEPPSGEETQELRDLRTELTEAQRAARTAEQQADRWRRDYKRLRGRRVVKASLKLADVWARARSVARTRATKDIQDGTSPPAGDSTTTPVRSTGRVVDDSGTVGTGTQAPTAPASSARIVASVAPYEHASGPLVSILIVTHDGADHLRRLLPALERTRYRSFEVVVVDEASDEETRRLLADWGPDFEVQVLRNEHATTFGAANEQAARASSGDYLLLLHDDIEPIDTDWLGHLMATMEQTGAGATGARLVSPAETSQADTGDHTAVGLTLQHRGVHFENCGEGLPRATNLGSREDATSATACAVREVPAVTDACLLVSRTVLGTVGGLDHGYEDGLADVDLCLRLRAAGHHIVVDGATALWHHGSDIRDRPGAWDAGERGDADRQLLASRWGPRLHREVLRDRISGAGEWSESPFHVAITVTRLEEARADEEWYAARDLGDALEALGWRVTFAEQHQDHWYDLPRDVDVLVILIDAFDLGRLRHAPLTVAWVRDRTDRWVSRPWFDDHDMVLATSEDAAQSIRAASTHEPLIFPLAAHRFRQLLLDWVDAPRMDVYTSVTNRKTEHRWGDTHYGRAVQRQLRRAGVTTRLVRHPQWGSIDSATADAVLHLFGRPGLMPRAAQISVLWNISHPELVTAEVCNGYDLVLVASEVFATVLREQVEVPVHVVHQASDPERFRPIPTGPPHDLLFVGNSRHVRRRIIDDLLPTEFDFGLYGWGWTAELVDLEHLRADHVPNAIVNTYYAASAIVLNDHYDEMRAHGFVSNRLYDALAAGAFVVSDHVEGIEGLFDGAVVTYADRDELRELIVRYLADPEARERLATKGRAAVLERHTFAHRVQQILGLLARQEMRSTVSGGQLRWPSGVPGSDATDPEEGVPDVKRGQR